MSPFRELPGVELGPLEVGLGRAARRAMMGIIPSGGRLFAPDSGEGAAWGEARPRRTRGHAAGALGSFGLVLVGASAFVAATYGWEPRSADGTAFAIALVIAGGLSLAAVLRALDAPRARPTVHGAVVGRAARRALRRALRLARHAARSPERFGPRRISALRRTLAMLADPLIADWIPADVRGRAELLLARAIAASAGARWTRDARVQAEVRRLLLSAADHLAEPAPARSDLFALSARAAPEPSPPLPSPARRADGEVAAARCSAPWDGDPAHERAAEDAHAAEIEGIEASGERVARARVRR